MTKHILYIILIVFLFTHAFLINSYSQPGDLDKIISLKVKDMPLGDVLNEIMKLGKIKFSFSNEQIPIDKKVSIELTDTPIKVVLDLLFKDLDIEYEIVEKQIVLKKNKPADNNESGNKKIMEQKYTINGYLKDKTTGEVLIGATIIIKNINIGTYTNPYGFYSITLPKGTYHVSYSYIGYKGYDSSVVVTKNQQISVDMKLDTTHVNEVIINAIEKENSIERSQMDEMKLRPAEIQNMTGFLGEVDLIKSLQIIPGICTFGDGSSMFYVRGGDRDQNLILIDEAPIYNPAHLLGFVSSIAPYAIKDINIYKGDMPSYYGDRLSSVIDVHTKDGNMTKSGVNLNLSPFTTDLSIEGPMKKNSSSFFISFRTSQLQWIVPFVPETYKESSNIVSNNMKLNFYDLNAKFNFKLNDKNRIFFSLYSGKDNFLLDSDPKNGLSWGNFAGTIRWNHLFNYKLFSNTTFYVSTYNYNLYIDNNNYWNSSITNVALKTDFSYYLNTKNTIRFGVSLSNQLFIPGNFISDNQIITQYEVPQRTADEIIFYAGEEQKVTDKITLQYGIRIPAWINVGPTTLYLQSPAHIPYDTMTIGKNKIYNTFINIEPRISALYSFSNSSEIKASYCRTVQYIQALSNSTSPFVTFDIWLPSDPNIHPQTANQFSLGYFQGIRPINFDLSVEAYYKRMFQQIDYVDNANMFFNPTIESEIRFGNAWAYGVEFMVKKSVGKLSGWVGYALSKVEKNTPGINNNQNYPASWDRPNNITLFLSYFITKRCSFSATWLFLTGSPFTSPTGFYYYEGNSIPIYTNRNNDRLPDYNRLDLSSTIKLNKKEKRFRHSLTFSLYNAYNRQNPYSVNFNKIQTPEGFVTPQDRNNPQELVSTMRSVMGIIPCVMYTFNY